MEDIAALRQQICEVGARVYARGFVAANSGNISCRLSDGSVLITPTGVSKGALRPEDLSRVALDGTVLEEGGHPLSSETKLHLAVYRAAPDMDAVVHTHPLHATYLSACCTMLCRPISADIIIQVGNIPVVPYAPLGSEALAEGAASAVSGYNAVLMANHGAVTWGRTLEEAYLRTEAVENYCSLCLLDEQHGRKARLLTREEVEALVRTRQSLGVMRGGFPQELL